jgi:hypothetical protein
VRGRISDYLRRNLLGLIAIFIALGGTAYATHPGGDNTIDTGDIINGQVKQLDIGSNQVRSAEVIDDTFPGGGLAAADLAANSVGPSELDAVAYDEVLTQETTQLGFPNSCVNLPTPGPSVTVDVPPTGLVAVFAEAEGFSVSGGASTNPAVCLDGPFSPSDPEILDDFAATFTRVLTAPSTVASQVGTTVPTQAGWVTVPLPPGPQTLTLQYACGGGGCDPSSATFRNRKLWVLPID